MADRRGDHFCEEFWSLKSSVLLQLFQSLLPVSSGAPCRFVMPRSNCNDLEVPSCLLQNCREMTAISVRILERVILS